MVVADAEKNSVVGNDDAVAEMDLDYQYDDPSYLYDSAVFVVVVVSYIVAVVAVVVVVVGNDTVENYSSPWL